LCAEPKPSARKPCAASFALIHLTAAGRSIPIEIYRPTDGAKHPLILMLHGSAGVYTNPTGEMPAEDNFGEKSIAEACFVVALPHYFEAVGQKSVTDLAVLKVDFPLFLATVEDLLGQLRKFSATADQPVGLYGESYGGFLAVALAAKCGCVRAVSEYSGGLPAGYGFLAKPPPFLLQHGEADELVPVAEALKLRDALREAGGPVVVHTYPGVGHYYNWAIRKTILSRTVTFFEEKLGCARHSGRPITSTTSSPR